MSGWRRSARRSSPPPQVTSGPSWTWWICRRDWPTCAWILRELSPHPTLEALSAAARRLAPFLTPKVEATHDDAQGPDTPRLVTFVARHKDLEGLHGVGIFAPFVTDERDLKRLGMDATSPETGRSAYEKLALAKAAKAWAPLVFDRLRAVLPEPVLAGIEGSGAGNRADRSAVTQMLASLDSTLDALDRRIAATRSKALANLPVATAVPAVLEQPALNMLGMMQLLRHEEVDKVLVATTTLTKGFGGSTPASSAPAWSGSTIGTGDQVNKTANAFVGLERLIGTTERTIRRTLTNGTFGLGPGLGAPRDKEGLLGAPRDKEGLLGAPRDKEGLLGRDKEGLLGRDKEGLLGRDKEGLLGITSSVSTAVATPGAIIAELFRQVGVAMRIPGSGGSGRRDDCRQGAARARWDPRLRAAVTRHARQVPSRTCVPRPGRSVDRSETDRSPRGVASNLRRRPRLTGCDHRRLSRTGVGQRLEQLGARPAIAQRPPAGYREAGIWLGFSPSIASGLRVFARPRG